MNKPEQNFWKLIKTHLPGDVSRVENIADSGTPDVSGAYRSNDYWVELKVCQNNKKERVIIDLLRPAQSVWHSRRGKHGSKIFVLVQYPQFETNAIVAYSFSYQQKYIFCQRFERYKNRWPWDHFTNWFIEQITEETF